MIFLLMIVVKIDNEKHEEYFTSGDKLRGIRELTLWGKGKS